MKIRGAHSIRSAASTRGVTLIECLVYITGLAIVMGVGSAALYRCWDDNKAISRNADDIVRTLNAGEIWRADVRSATGPIAVTKKNSEETDIIPCGTNVVSYSFANGEVRRQSAKDRPWIIVLPRIKSSQMESDPRDHARAWRWEVGLETRRKNPAIRPLFTFEAVAGNSVSQ